MSKKKKKWNNFWVGPVYRYRYLLIFGLIDRWEEKQEAEIGRTWGKEGTEEGKETEKEGQRISQAFQRKIW